VTALDRRLTRSLTPCFLNARAQLDTGVGTQFLQCSGIEYSPSTTHHNTPPEGLYSVVFPDLLYSEHMVNIKGGAYSRTSGTHNILLITGVSPLINHEDSLIFKIIIIN